MAKLYEILKLEEEKKTKEKQLRERERQYKAIRKNEREKLIEELEKAINEKINYAPINEMVCVPVITVEELVQIFKEAKERSEKIKRFTQR